MDLNLLAVAKKKANWQLASGEKNPLISVLIASADAASSTKYHIKPAGAKRGGGPLRWKATLNVSLTNRLEGTGSMPLTRGEVVGYDADSMAFGFTMKNGQQIVRCQISRAALVDLAGRSTGVATRDLPAQFEAHRELIEAIASAQFDQTSNEETRLVRIFAKDIPSNPTQK
jgi:hypothetical protein